MTNRPSFASPNPNANAASVLSANVSASSSNPVIPENHFCRTCVLQALLYTGTDTKVFTEYKYSKTTERMEFYAATRIGTLDNVIGILRISATLTYK